MNAFNIIDYVIVGIYMLSMLLIGFLVRSFSKGDEDYFKGGNKIPWAMSAMSLFIGSFSAYMFVAASGQAYKTGFSCLLLFTSPAYACIVIYFLMAHLWRRTRITSPMELIEMRYGNGVRYFFTFVPIPFGILGAGNLLFVLSIFISSALGFTGEYNILWFTLNGLELCILVTGIIIVIYTTVGGLWAVILTDTVQFIIVMVMSMIVVPLSFMALGKGRLFSGIQHFISNPPTEDYFHLVKPSQTLIFSVSWILLTLFSTMGNNALGQRCYSVPTEKDAKKTVLLSGIFYIIAPIIWVLPIFVMRPFLTNMESLWPQLKNPNEATYVTITLMLLPNGMIGLTVSAILAATMSTVSTVYNIFSSIFIRDIYKPLFARKADSRDLMHVGRWVTLAYGMITILMGFILARYGKADAFKTTFTIGSHTGLVFAFPIIVGLLFRRIPWWSPFVSAAICLVTTLSLEIFFGVSDRSFSWGVFENIRKYLFEWKIFGAIFVNVIVYLIVALFYNEKDPMNKKADHLFALLKKPVSEDSDADLFVPNLKTYRIVGLILAFFGIAMIVLWISGIVNDPRNINLIAGVFFLALFALIEWFTSARFSPFITVRNQTQQKDAHKQ
ncbi:hypothetical protein JW926_06160 [Candidatus Sumerlaeota bacterium]|nr:hypothetical protein [Candidatus Sumerlaeota bacterium]